MDLYEILSRVSVINRDNGKRFKQTDRLDAIASLLWDSRYRRIDSAGLFHMYAVMPPERIGGSVVVVSSHVDCAEGITRCFARRSGDGVMRGTYDNAITNAAIIRAMLDGRLPDDVLVAFTGDEEQGSKGADDVALFLKSRGLSVRAIVVLDVTDEGWEDRADFTVENDFWREPLARKVVSFAESTGCRWRFVPSDLQAIPACLDAARLVPREAEPDESWQYDEHHLPCFSFCLPVRGEMHSDEGVLVRKASFEQYCQALQELPGQI